MSQDSGEPGFYTEMARAEQRALEGTLDFEEFLRLARSREPSALKFCLEKLAEPELGTHQERLLARALFHLNPVSELFHSLSARHPELLECLGSALSRAAPVDPETGCLTFQEEYRLVRAVSHIEQAEPVEGRLPALLVLQSLESPGLQAVAAFQVALLDQDLVYVSRLLHHPAARVRANALEALVHRNDRRGLTFFKMSASDNDPRVRASAALGLSRLGEDDGFRMLTEMVQNGNRWERRSAIWALSLCGGEEHASLLGELDSDEVDDGTRSLAAAARTVILERLSVSGQ